MTDINFRVDSRLIHGQVIARWLVKWQFNKVIIVDDSLSKDDFMKDIYVMAAPSGMDVAVYDVDEMISKWNNGEIDKKKLLVLFADVLHVKRIVDGGVAVENLQIGGLPSGPGRTLVYKAISLSEDDFKNLDEIEAKKTNIYFQMLPEETPQPYEKIKGGL